MSRSLAAHFDPAALPKRILSLDGGGTLGIIEIAFLEQIEEILRARRGGDPQFRLCHYFDLIGGTSTGALIAAALALGLRASQVRELYLAWGPVIFRSPFWGIPGLSPRFSASGLQSVLREIVGGRTLDSPDLQTGLAIVLKRIDTGSPWVLSNNPRAKYWDDPAPDNSGAAYFGNRHYSLAQVLRASTAAPYYFEPQAIPVVPGETAGLFVDGSVSPHNNPALLLLMMAGMAGYRFDWRLDRDALLLISIGAGTSRPRLAASDGRRMAAVTLAARALTSVIHDTEVQSLKILQWLTATRRPWPINSEVDDVGKDRLEAQTLVRRELATFQRYDLAFEAAWLAEHTGQMLSEREIARLNDFMSPAIMTDVYALATAAAKRLVEPEDLPAGFDIA